MDNNCVTAILIMIAWKDISRSSIFFGYTLKPSLHALCAVLYTLKDSVKLASIISKMLKEL
eukprot:7135127-Ditylum_brightwellii.AAC.1